MNEKLEQLNIELNKKTSTKEARIDIMNRQGISEERADELIKRSNRTLISMWSEDYKFSDETIRKLVYEEFSNEEVEQLFYDEHLNRLIANHEKRGIKSPLVDAYIKILKMKYKGIDSSNVNEYNETIKALRNGIEETTRITSEGIDKHNTEA